MGNTTRSLSVERGIESSMQLEETPNSEGRQVVSGVCKVLSLFYFQICKDSSPINVLNEEGCGDAVRSFSAAGVPAVEGHPMQCTDASLSGSKTTIYGGDGCFGDSNGVCVLMQDQGDGPHPITFMSGALKPSEHWYLAYEKELTAIAYCFIHW